MGFNSEFKGLIQSVSLVAGDDSVATPASNRFRRALFKYVTAICDTRENATIAQFARPLTLPYVADCYYNVLETP